MGISFLLRVDFHIVSIFSVWCPFIREELAELLGHHPCYARSQGDGEAGTKGDGTEIDVELRSLKVV